MKKSTLAMACRNLAKGIVVVLGGVSVLSLFVNFLNNLQYFDTHSPVAGQYPEGLASEILSTPFLFAIIAIAVYVIVYKFCKKWYIYERKMERR